MFISVIGSKGSGKTSIVNYLVTTGFTLLRLDPLAEDSTSFDAKLEYPSSARSQSPSNNYGHNKHLSFLSMTFSPAASPVTSQLPGFLKSERLTFSTTEMMLEFVTRNWKINFVTDDLISREDIDVFVKRPFFMLVRVDAPTLHRFRRTGQQPLEEFLLQDDIHRFGSAGTSTSLHHLGDLVNVEIVNDFESLSGLHKHLENINLLDPDHLRPNWDQYFMTLASLAANRSNCMKRRVGAILVREHRIVATGYNGTPRGVTNCTSGGCARCNSGNEVADECVCLHAEENALLEAGRERVGQGSVLYCNTCPCLKCTIKIIQTGVTEVVYNLSYKVDEASAALMEEAGIRLRQYSPKSPRNLPVGNSKQDTFPAYPPAEEGKSSAFGSPQLSMIASSIDS